MKVCHNSILREYTCTSHRNQCRARKSLHCVGYRAFDLLFFFLIHLPVSGLRCSLCTVYHQCKYKYACLNVKARVCVCACGFVEISGNTGNYQRNLQQCHGSLGFSDLLLCYLQVCPASDDKHLVCFFFFFSWHRAFCSCTNCLPSERRLYTWSHWGGDKTEVPTCPEDGSGQISR